MRGKRHGRINRGRQMDNFESRLMWAVCILAEREHPDGAYEKNPHGPNHAREYTPFWVAHSVPHEN
jgi:hypothetical protein